MCYHLNEFAKKIGFTLCGKEYKGETSYLVKVRLKGQNQREKKMKI